MFCIKCGCRIPANASKCPDCGADRPGMEYCGGFWSELNQNTQCPNHSPVVSKEKTLTREMDVKKEHLNSNDAAIKLCKKEKNAEKSPFLRNTVMIEGAIILILFLYTLVSGVSLRKQISEAEANGISAEERYTELVKEYEDISAKYEELKKENENKRENTDSQNSDVSENIEANTGTTMNEAAVEEADDKERSVYSGQTEDFPEKDPMQEVFQEEKKDNF